MARIELMTELGLSRMREACQLAGDILCMVGDRLEPGVSTDDINAWVHEYMLEHNAHPATLNYHGYPKSSCISINEVVCHGIPDRRCIKNGDIVNVDVTPIFPANDGYHGDTSATFYIGEPTEEAKRLVEVARESLERAIAVVREDARIGDIGHAIQSFAEAQGFSVVRDYVGHGVGRQFHMPPQIPHYGKAGTGKRLKANMVFTIEPMINAGTFECRVLKDDWTVVTADGRLSAQFEHTVAVTKTGCEVLTARKRILKGSEDVAWARLGPLNAPAAFAAVDKAAGGQ